MGATGGLLGILRKTIKSPTIVQRIPFLRAWLTSIPFALLVIGLWESSTMLLNYTPPIGVGAGCGELLGPTFYVIAFIMGSAVLSALAAVTRFALSKKPKTQ